MLVIFTGNGKGKTTSAIGQAVRAVGAGRRVLMVQFIKGPWKSGEDESHKAFGGRFKIKKMGLGFVGIGGDTLPRAAHRKAAKDALAYAKKEAGSGRWDLLVLDEVWNAHALKLVGARELSSFISHALPRVEHLIMTGRDCPDAFIKKAHLVTEMREVKHPFNGGTKGVKGFEY